MMRKLVAIFVVFPLGVLLVAFAVANRQPVTLALDPFGTPASALSATLPLFLLVLATLLVGVLAGGFTAWIGQGRWRRAARRLETEARALRGERDALKAELARGSARLPVVAA
jgi:uncharacterized integral membrane protein